MYSIRIDQESRDRYQNGDIRFARVHQRQSTNRPCWIGGSKIPWVLRHEVHQWFEEAGINYTLHWRHGTKTLLDENEEEFEIGNDFRWEVDVEESHHAILVKLRWGITRAYMPYNTL